MAAAPLSAEGDSTPDLPASSEGAALRALADRVSDPKVKASLLESADRVDAAYARERQLDEAIVECSPQEARDVAEAWREQTGRVPEPSTEFFDFIVRRRESTRRHAPQYRREVQRTRAPRRSVGCRRPRARGRRPGARRAAGNRSGQDPGDDGGEPEPPDLALQLGGRYVGGLT